MGFGKVRYGMVWNLRAQSRRFEMESALVKIRGVGRGYLQHKYDLAPQLSAGMLGEVKKLKGTTRSYEEFELEAKSYLFKDKTGRMCLPSIHLDGCLKKSGAEHQIEGRGKKTYKQGMMASVKIEPDLILLTPQDYSLDMQFVRVARAGIPRARPRFNAGWEAEFTVIITDSTLTMATVKNMLEYGGRHVGLGDFRPRFGLFEVVSVTPVK